jgi:MFS transporter, ACS family, pantothenate transporter
MILCSWAPAHLEGEPEVRTVLFASGIIAYILSAFLPLATYPASEAPNWRVGAKVYLGFACASVSLSLSVSTWPFGGRRRARRTKGGLESGGGCGGGANGESATAPDDEKGAQHDKDKL